MRELIYNRPGDEKRYSYDMYIENGILMCYVNFWGEWYSDLCMMTCMTIDQETVTMDDINARKKYTNDCCQ
jgi:hypothetical protein